MIKKKKYEILDSLPAYGPMYIPISENEEKLYSEGLVVKFFKEDGTEWVANFSRDSGIEKIIDYSDKDLIIVFAGGIGYVMNPNNEEPLKTIGSTTKHIFQSDSGEIICIDDIGIQVFDPETLDIWISERISFDGFTELTFSNGILKGKSFDPTNSTNQWTRFSFDIENKEIKGGSFREMLKRNPHFEMENRIELKSKSKKKQTWWKIWK